MKLTTFLTSSLLLSLSHLISAGATETEIVVDQSTDDTLEKVYVNADGEVVIPEVFHWGRPALKEKDAAKPRMCGGKLDASGRLGKRQATCPTGYSIACDAYSANPCCPNSSPVCCTNASVCCGTGQFCQGTSTCCNAGQIGCGEACCNYGETCCGSNCCGAGFTCSNGSCVAPSGSTPTTLSSASASSVSEVSRVATGISTVIAPVTTTSSSTSSSTCSSGGGNGNGNGNSNSNSNYQYNGPSASTIGGAVGGSLSALSTALAALSAWFYKKKNQAEAALAAVIAPKPAPVEEKPEPTPPSSETAKEEPEAYESPNENTWIERPITGTPGIAGHGNAYT